MPGPHSPLSSPEAALLVPITDSGLQELEVGGTGMAEKAVSLGPARGSAACAGVGSGRPDPGGLAVPAAPDPAELPPALPRGVCTPTPLRGRGPGRSAHEEAPVGLRAPLGAGSRPGRPSTPSSPPPGALHVRPLQSTARRAAPAVPRWDLPRSASKHRLRPGQRPQPFPARRSHRPPARRVPARPSPSPKTRLPSFVPKTRHRVIQL